MDKELRQRLKRLLKVAKELRRRKLTFKIVGADLTWYEPGQCTDGGRYAFYKVIVCEPNKSPYYIYSTSADFVYCPLTGNFCSCGGGVREDKECYKMAQKKHRIKLTISNLASVLEGYLDEVCIRVKGYWWLDQETKQWLFDLGFLEDEMCF